MATFGDKENRPLCQLFANFGVMMFDELHNSAELMDLIDRIGFLPLLDSGIRGFSAEDIVAFDRIIKHLHSICPNATESQLIRMIK